MKAVRAGEGAVRVVEVDEPDGPGELVRIRSASICSSDFMYLRYGSTRIIGHELAGTLADGTPVAIEAIFGCGECEHCLAGRVNHCHTVSTGALGMTADGGMSEWFRAPASALVPLPEGLAVADASLVEPTAVAWHAARIAGVGPATRVAVVGGGAIGLMAGAAAQALGAPEVALEARHRHQIEAGERLGFVTPTGGYDVVLEAAGSQSSLHRAAELARPGGTLAYVGVFDTDVEWPHGTLFHKELRLQPSLGYCRHEGGRDFVDSAGLLAARPDLVDVLVTHRFPIDDAEAAFAAAGDRAGGTVRVLVQP